VAAGMMRLRQEERKIAVPNSRLAGNREAAWEKCTECLMCALQCINVCFVLGLVDIKGGRRCHLLLNKRWNLLPSFLSNEPGIGQKTCTAATDSAALHSIPNILKMKM
jgi:hypothetical protein